MKLEGWDLEPTWRLGRGWGLEIAFNHVASDLINCAYVMKP